MRITPIALFSLVSACGGDQTFSQSTEDTVDTQGTSSMTVSHTEITFTDLDWEGQIAKSEVFKITNVGDNNLQLDKVDLVNSGGGAFYMEDNGSLVLAPGVEREFTVVASLETFEAAEGEARIISNDVDNREVRIPLYAFPVGWEGEDTGGEDTGGEDTGGADTGA